MTDIPPDPTKIIRRNPDSKGLIVTYDEGVTVRLCHQPEIRIDRHVCVRFFNAAGNPFDRSVVPWHSLRTVFRDGLTIDITSFLSDDDPFAEQLLRYVFEDDAKLRFYMHRYDDGRTEVRGIYSHPLIDDDPEMGHSTLILSKEDADKIFYQP